MNSKLKIMKLCEDAILPERATLGSAGLDLSACIKQPVCIAPNELAMIPTGIAAGLPSHDYAAFVFARSGLAVRHGIALSNGVGVIDSDYTGEIKVGLCNLSQEAYTIEPGERIAQLVVMPVCVLPVEQVDSLSQTERNNGGFGSTGRK